jgi:hypothetical protein
MITDRDTLDGGGAAARTRATAAAPTRPATSAAHPKALTNLQLTEIMAILQDVQSVELKLTVPSTSQRATIRGVGLDPVEAEPRQIFFFDTPDLRLNKAGLIVRARRIQGGSADTAIKLRPVVPSELPKRVRRSGACKIELDVLPGGYVCSASLTGTTTGQEVKSAVAGKIAISEIFTGEQRAFYAAHASKGLAIDRLSVLGPTFVLKSRFYAKKLDRKVTAELWLYPDGSRILELSIKAKPQEAFQVGASFRAWLASRGVETGGEQQTKTAAALRFFSAHLQAAKNGR